MAIAWCATTQADAFTNAVFERVLASGGHVPAVFWFEVVHGLRRLERTGTLTQEIADQFVEKLAALPLIVDAPYASEDIVHLHGIARKLALTIYDASYVELALRLGLPLATRDRFLADATRNAGATLLRL
ncbi:MAG TPA: type II toxin-antitoxin system VapC family toxin [Xanthobacteraceae bacterium]|nr:type II toxin-antitoxin system VapC family toxin [Xanthobacteraceae bacterium]